MMGNPVNIWKIKGKENRIILAIPVHIEGEDGNNQPFSEETTTENVSRHGVCIVTNCALAVGSTLRLSAFQGKFQNQAVVKGVWVDERDKKTKAGLEFTNPIRNWIIN
jgi:hypothetical protein